MEQFKEVNLAFTSERLTRNGFEYIMLTLKYFTKMIDSCP